MDGDKSIIVPEVIAPEATLKADESMVITATELEVFHYVKRRLSYLVKDDALFDEIAHVEYRDYKGKFVLFYKKERVGRLFDFTEGGAKKYTFDFGLNTGGEVSTVKLTDVDAALLAIFTKRVEEFGASKKGEGRANVVGGKAAAAVRSQPVAA